VNYPHRFVPISTLSLVQNNNTHLTLNIPNTLDLMAHLSGLLSTYGPGVAYHCEGPRCLQAPRNTRLSRRCPATGDRAFRMLVAA
jgi:hypothetical protein